jgi:hypothetical protein
MQAGLDSLGAVELRNAVRGHFSIEIPATLAMDYPTIEAMAAYIGTLLPSRDPPPQAHLANALAPAYQDNSTTLATDIITIAAKYPGAERDGA